MSHNELDVQRRTAKIEPGPHIAVRPSSFSSSDVHVCEGQVVTFTWDEKSKEFMHNSDGQNVVQVVSVDRTDVKVPGGYQSGPVVKNGEYSIQFNLAGKYTFINEGAKKKAAPLNVTVESRQHYNVIVTDGGFRLKVITIDQGNWINFVWTNCQIPHSVTQLEFCDRHCGFTVKKQRGVVPTHSGSYKHKFRHPGIYYFQTQQASADSGICVVQVQHVTREYMVEVKDRRFEPMILLIEEGDKVWFRWENTRDAHCVYQISPPAVDQPAADEYRPVSDGFKWHEPTTTGLLAHQFNEPGVFYYTDRDFSYAASYIGTIIVKPRQKEHFVRVQPSAYTPALLPATTGDRIWWQWTPSEMQKAFALKQIEQCLSPLAKDVKDYQCEGACRPMTEKQIITFCKAGVQSSVVNSVGIYHYKIPEVVDVLPTSTVLVESGDKNFTVKVDDEGFTPRFATIGPGCRVWFIWQGTQKQHNIQQVTYEGVPVSNGFNSGATRDAPSAFMHQFHTPGVYYFVSKSLPRLFGAVIVATQPQVHAINVRANVKPDPLSVAENDVVYWAFNEEKRHDITQIHSLAQAINMPHSKLLPPRLIMNRVFADYGVYHFTGLSMIDHTRHGSSSSIEAEDLRISSVIVDEQTDKNCVRVDSSGFHPRNITIKKGDSVLWSWRKERDQEHNIVHVNTPDSESPLSVVKGKKAFNSGKPVRSNSYMHTFDDIGYFCVASQGAPGYAGSVTVIGNGKKVQTPFIDYTEQMGGSVELNHQVELKCATQNATIYYSIDGSIPYPWHKQAQDYDPKTGVVLKYPGLCFIRACAIHDDMVDSEIFTSRRFAVDEKAEGSIADSESVDYTPTQKEAHRLWLMCEPRIRAYLLTDPGEMNIVWNELSEQCMRIVKGYRLYINGVIYCTSFPPSYSVINVSGLAGGNTYEVVLECLPEDPALVPLRSNRITLRCSERVEGGGPLISLERSSKSDELIIVWKNVSTQSYPFRGYLVYLNNVECGSMIVPEVHQHKCRAVIATHAGVRYSVMVAAVPVDHSPPRMSNELSVTLPLDTAEVVLPPQELRVGNNPDIYKEYLEVRDGNSDPSSVASDSSDTATETDTSITPRTEAPNGHAIPAPSVDQQRDSAADLAMAGIRVMNSPPTNVGRVVESPKPVEHVIVPGSTTFERAPSQPRKITAEVEVHAEAHDVFLPVREREIIQPLLVPMDSVTDPEEPVLTAEDTPASPKATFVAPPEGYKLPVPVVHIEHIQGGGEMVKWELSALPDMAYKLTSFAINVIGESFTTDVNSDISFECIVNSDGEKINLLQHVWNVTGDHMCRINGLANGSTYRIYVAANWTFLAGNYPRDTQSRSIEFDYTTVGAPQPPVLKATKTELLNQVTIEWSPAKENSIPVAGYKVLLNGTFDFTINGEPASKALPPSCTQTTIDRLVPGRTVKVQVIAVTNHPVGDSRPSNTLNVTCPALPEPPLIVNQPSYKKGVVVIAWDAPKSSVVGSPGHAANITYYSIYVDGVWHGEIKANQASDSNGYQYYMTDLKPGVSYDVFVKSIAGQKVPEGNTIFCLCESNLSNTVPVTCAAPPASPHIYIESMTPQGIDITWEVPQQYGDAVLSGYQLIKNGSIYGSTIPPEVTSMSIKDVSLGEDVKLQIIALTEHPVGGSDNSAKDRADGRYAECKPGPKLTLQYTGLVSPVTKLWTEKVTGHQLLLVWKHKMDRQKAHFQAPDSYQVTWWPGDVPEGHINSCSTTDDHLHIQDLKPNTVYTVIVEARRKQHYIALDEMENGPGEEINRHFIISAKSKKLTVRTGQPPEPPSNLGVLASTCHSLQIGWDPPRERGVEVKFVRVDCIPVHKKTKTHICEELLPSETVINLHNLCEHTEYDIVITAVTEEFFESLPLGHEWKKDRQIPHNNVEMPDNEWLPKSTITVRTSGTEPPTDLTLKKVSDTSAELSWNPSVVFGNNRLLSYVVRWTRLDPNAAKENEHYMEHMNLHKRETTATISSLVPGFQYRIVVEAVVSVKTAIEAIDGDEEKNRRTTHIPSMPLLVRARAPVQPPILLLTGYTPSTASLYWDKPVLCSVVARDAEGAPVYVKRYLEGYRLYINGKLHMRLDNSAQSLTLTKCKPGKTYDISLVALTSTEAARREKKRGIRAEDDSDESLSMPITVSLPTIHSGNFENISAAFVEESNKEVGSIHVKWNVQSHSKDIKQWNVIWYEREEGMLHKTGVEPHNNSCIIPIDKRKRVYEVSIEPDMYGQKANPPTQRMQVVTPGPVDPPEIFLRCVNEKDFTIEWGEPRCYGGVKVKGYQLYMNDKKIGHVLSSTHRKAVIPCRPNRQYKVCMFAIGSEYGNSTTSNSLLINTPGSRFAAGQLLDSSIVDFESWEASDQTDLKVRSSQVTDTSMKIDWVYENKPRGIRAYKVVWSCTTQPKDREVRVDTGESEYSLVLQKLFPGITHYIKVFAIGESDVICEKSKQIIVQTSAPPDTPVTGIRACNLKYISIHWEKPKCYGSAHITGYRVYVDGICEAVNGPDQLIFNYTSGKFCTEYSFQVQAITDNDLSSKPSDPLLVKWPGIIPPTIRQLPSETNSSLKLGWEIPYCTEGIKLKHYKVVCREGDTEKVVQTVSPIHPETTQAELYNVRKGTYQIYLEIYLHNASEIFRTDAISVEPFIFPDPPTITVTIVGLEERRQLEKVTSDLVNKRYRLMSVLADGGKNEGVITGHKFKRTEMVHAQAKAKDYLIHVDQMLDDCFQSLSNLTGALVVHVSWTSTQSSQDVSISGYRVLVDKKQFGTTLHAGVNNVRLKLNLDVPVHRISMVAVSAQPHGLSDESNTVDVLTAPFRPFVAFCYHNIHQPDERWPNPGCCRYDASVNYERQQKKMKPTYKGLLHKQLAPPQVNVLDVFECEFKPLLPLNGPDKPTILLFWNSWCLASQRNVEYMFKFSQFNNHKYDFISLACGLDVTVPQERADLVHCITSNGWNDHQAMWHVTDQSASTVIAAQSFIKQNLLGADGKRLKNPANGPQIAFGNTSDLLGLTGVPSIVVIHPANYIAWMGAFCAYDQHAFDVFIEHIMAETLDIDCPMDSCVQCQSATDLFGLLSARYTQKSQTYTPGLIESQSQTVRRPASSKKPRKQRPQSAKTPSVTSGPRSRPMSASSAGRRSSHSSAGSKSSISVAKRPYSATPMEEDKESVNSQPISVSVNRRDSAA